MHAPRCLGVVLAMVGVGACGDNVAPDGDVRSGSRLKLAWYVYEGGARERETSWYFDAALQLRCSPQLWSDGHRYCAPASDEAVYVSDTCTRALGRTLLGEEPAPYFSTRYRLPGEFRPVPSRLFTPGPRTQPPVAIWEKTSSGCIGPMDAGSAYEYYELGEELFVDDLVRLRRGEPEGSGALAVIYETSDDGLRVPAALYSRDAASECTVADLPNAPSVACEPVDALRASFFHDATCSDVVLGTPSFTPPRLAFHVAFATRCRTFYRVGREVAAAMLYERNELGCLISAPPDGLRFFAMEDTQPLPELARQIDATEHRIRGITRSDGDVRVPDPLLYDAELDADCSRDDELRCAPKTDVRVELFFADAECQTPLLLALVPMGTCDPPVRYAVDDQGRYYPIAAPHTGAIHVPSTGDTCGTFAPKPPFVAYTVGPALDPSRLARAELRIDP